MPRVEQLARAHDACRAELDIDLVSKALKPLPFAFLRALSKCDSTRARAAVVGDQLFTDVLGGKLLGMHTVLVLPLSATDLPHTLILRRVERLVLGSRQPVDGSGRPPGEESS